MIPAQFVLLGLALNLFGISTYIRDTLKGKTKPNKVTWFLWALAPLIAFVVQRDAGIGWINVLTFSVGFAPLLVFIFSFMNKQSYWKISVFDIFCGALSVVALVFWLITSNAIVSVLLLIIADLAAGIPTLVKAYRYPETESYRAFLCGIGNSLIALLTLDMYSFLHLGFPVYILIMDTTFFLLMFPKTNVFFKSSKILSR